MTESIAHIVFKSADEVLKSLSHIDRASAEKIHDIWFKAAIKSAFHPEMTDDLMAAAKEQGLQVLRAAEGMAQA